MEVYRGDIAIYYGDIKGLIMNYKPWNFPDPIMNRSPLNSMDCRHFSGAVGFRTFSFQVGLEKPQEEDPAARPFSGPNNWPNEVPELREVFEKKLGGEESLVWVEGLKCWFRWQDEMYSFRWWQLKDLLCSPRSLGEDFQFD